MNLLTAYFIRMSSINIYVVTSVYTDKHNTENNLEICKGDNNLFDYLYNKVYSRIGDLIDHPFENLSELMDLVIELGTLNIGRGEWLLTNIIKIQAKDLIDITTIV